jgi:hypothetical protein
MFVLWTHDFAHRTSISKKHYKEMTEMERRTKLCEPIKIAPEHENETLERLAELYPLPNQVKEK